MRSGRNWALVAGVLLFVLGIVVWADGGAGAVLCLFGALIAVSAVVERTYGNLRSRPRGGQWRPTEERFVDPESGRLVTVWFEPATGERRYVTEDDTTGHSLP